MVEVVVGTVVVAWDSKNFKKKSQIKSNLYFDSLVVVASVVVDVVVGTVVAIN